MLFAFPDETSRRFTTWGMTFPIDIAFFDSHGRLVQQIRSVQPGHSMLTYPHRYAIELPAGSLQAHGVTDGTLVTISGATNALARAAT